MCVLRLSLECTSCALARLNRNRNRWYRAQKGKSERAKFQNRWVMTVILKKAKIQRISKLFNVFCNYHGLVSGDPYTNSEFTTL